MKSLSATAVKIPGSRRATLARVQRIDDMRQPSPRMARAAGVPARVPDYVVDVSCPVVPWRWTSVLLAPLELLAVAWTIPFVILSIGIPIALAVALVYWAGRFLLSYF